MREDQARGQKREEQERGEPGRPEREPEARGDPAWGPDEEAVRAPHSSDFFFRSRQGKEEHLGPGWSREAVTLDSLWPPPRLGADEGQ